jgi:pimeloyl-ACP methyl ester carboxylesterase
VFQGLVFENKPLTGFQARYSLGMYRFLEEDYTIYLVARKPGLPEGYSMQDMSDDYARMIEDEFEGPVDVIGHSTGGSIAFHFAADHSRLVRRLIIHSSAYRLSDAAREVQMRVAHFARQGKWRAAYAEILGSAVTPNWAAPAIVWLGSLMMSVIDSPGDPSDLIVTIEAEDKHDFKERLAQITVPTLVVGGDEDMFYSGDLFRKTAEGMPNAQLALYEGMGHPASGDRFQQDVLTFLREDTAGNE